MGGSDEQFCLRWNDYHESMVATLQELRAHEDFVDVTLVCDGAEIRAHKLILSACSDFFRHLLKRTPPAPATPVIVLWDITAQDLRHILRYMYNGEVEVQQANLNNFLAVAERLRVRGLCQSGGNSSPIHPTATGATTGNKRAGSASPRARSPSGSGHGNRRASMDLHNSSKKQKRMSSSAVDPEISIKEETPNIRGGASGDKEDVAGPSDYTAMDGGADGAPGMLSRRSGSEADEYAEYGYGGNGSGRGMMDEDDGSYPGEAGAGGGSGQHASMPLMELWRRTTMAQMARISMGGGNRGSDSNSPNNTYDDHNRSSGSTSGEPARRQRSVYSSSQISQLEAFFAINEYIDGERKKQLSRMTNIPEQQIKVWFQNRRQKKKREMEEAVAREQEQERMPPGAGGAGMLMMKQDSDEMAAAAVAMEAKDKLAAEALGDMPERE